MTDVIRAAAEYLLALRADREAPPKAVCMLGCRDVGSARRQARRELKSARHCPCCRGLLTNLFDRVGSTLFLDDDPEQLLMSFQASEKDAFGPRVLAACVVLFGRPRLVVSVPARA